MPDNQDMPPKAPTDGAVDAIRNIIFGEQEKLFQKKIELLEKQIDDLHKKYESKLDELTRQLGREREEYLQQMTEITRNLQTQEKGVDSIINSLKDSIEKKISQLEQKKANHASLAKQFEKLSDYFKENQ